MASDVRGDHALELAVANLDEGDLELIRRQRSPRNRLGLALQLCVLRATGAFPVGEDVIPRSWLSSVAGRCDLPSSSDLAPYFAGSTSARHRTQIREREGLRSFDEPAVFMAFARWLLQRTWTSQDPPEVLLELATARLRARKVELPAAWKLERLLSRARTKSRYRLYRALVTEASREELVRLEGLIRERADEGAAGPVTELERLRRGRQRTTCDGVVESLERLEAVRALGGGSWRFAGVPAQQIACLAGEAASLRPHELRRMPVLQRRASLIAFTQRLRISAQDDVIHVLDFYLRGLLSRVARRDERKRTEMLAELDEAARDLAVACAMVLDADVPDDELRREVFKRIEASRLKASVDAVREISATQEAGPLAGLKSRGVQLRRILPRLLRSLEFEGRRSAGPVLEAWSFLGSIEGERRPRLGMAPTELIRGPWRRVVWNADGSLDRQLYSWCVLVRFLEAIRRRDVYVPGSFDFADPRAALLSGQAWERARPRIREALDLPETGEEAVERLRLALERGYHEAGEVLDEGEVARLREHQGRGVPLLSRLAGLPVTESQKRLRSQVAELLPRADLSSLLLEVDAWTDFTSALLGARGRRPSRVRRHMRVGLCAVLLAEACNIGLRAVARPKEDALRYDRLRWLRRRYFDAAALTDANARLVDAQSRLPLAGEWGGGQVASADGLRFVVPVRSANAAANPRYFGRRKGLTYYNFVSDQFTGFHALVVPGTIRDSLFVLDGMLEHRTSLQPTELMTDTAGYSDAVFGLFWLLGFQFSPRLRDISGLRYWRIDPEADHGPLNALARFTIRRERIEEQWEDLLRIAGSLRLGTVRASDFMRTLQTGGKVSRTRQAVVALGRAVKTLYVLSYISDEPYRRHIQKSLNRGESRHALARSVFFGQRGRIHRAYREGQENQLGALGFVVNAIVLWNTVYIAEVLEWLKASGAAPVRADVARLSPLVQEHIGFVGRYPFELPERVASGGRRKIEVT